MLIAIISALSLLAFDAPGGTVIDRIAIVVGKRAIKASDIDRDIRLTAFLNREPLAFDANTRKQASDRLIDQQIIRKEVATGEYPRASDADAAAMLNQIRASRFGGSEARLSAELNRYGISPSELQEHLLWQLTVLRFIDERFRPGVQVTDEEIRKYYDDHLAALRRQYPKDSSFESLEPKIRDLLEGQEINKQFGAWLDDARGRTFIEFHEQSKTPESTQEIRTQENRPQETRK
jgi:peptidyl-prolyl cis-trans isomerase SurA